MSCANLATILDQEMLEGARRVTIFPASTPDDQLPSKTGAEVARELGGRYLLRYMLVQHVGKFADGANTPQWTTPTPYSPHDTVHLLALPAPTRERDFVIILDPAKIQKILGPRWVRCGKGIEYFLPDGFPKSSMILPWEFRIE